MTLFIKIIIVLLLIFGKSSFAQNNIFDCENSKRFSNYLFNTDQFELAQHELERIAFFCKIDSSSQLILLKSYRKLYHFSKANSYFESKSFDEIKLLNPEYRKEYIRLSMAQQQYKKVQESINKGLNFSDKFEHQIGTKLLLSNWEEAYQISNSTVPYSNYKVNSLRKVAKESFEAKRKKPWIATALSVILPGSGKIYSGYWGDGIISFLFTSSTSFFAYRAFNKYGNNKVYPWIVGGLAVSYYTANIYGGNRAAIKYNDNLDHDFIHKTEQILFSDY